MKINDIVRRERLRLALSVEELAERSGLSRQGVYLIEAGQRSAPRMSTLRKLAKGLGVDVSVLVSAAVPDDIGPDAEGAAA